jgi:hypothetical protein
MKTTKVIQFKIHGKVLEELEGEATIDVIEEIKTSLAFIHSVGFDDVEVIAEDVIERELSDLQVNSMGKLVLVTNVFGIVSEVHGVKAKVNLRSNKGLDEICKKGIEKLLNFI